MRPTENIKKLIRDASIKTHPAVNKAVLNNLFDELDKTKKIDSAILQPSVWRIIMKSRIIKLAAAAVIIIAVLAGIYFTTGRTPAVTCCAWAEIADRVGQIKTCTWKTHIQTRPAGTQEVDTDTDAYISSEYGIRMDAYSNGNLTMQTYLLPKEKVFITLMPPAKQYIRMLLTDERLTEMKKKVQNPQGMVKNFMSGEYTELGTQTIDGVLAKGIKTVNPPAMRGLYDNYIGTLWIDVKTQLPIQLEFEAEMSAGAKKMAVSMVMDGFEWGAELTPEIFEPNIPSDYTMMAEMKMPGQDEASALEGLRTFAEIADGKYPSSLNMTTMIQETQDALKKKMNLDPNTKPNEEQMKQMMQKMATIQGTFMFYIKLTQESKDPAYYGKDVTAGDANAVLMRWKISEDTYRVILGDLTVENVNAEQLKEMEQAAHQ